MEIIPHRTTFRNYLRKVRLPEIIPQGEPAAPGKLAEKGTQIIAEASSEGESGGQAVDILPMLEAEAKERQRVAGEQFGRGQEKQVQIIAQPIEPDDTGRARAHAVDILPMLEAEAKERQRVAGEQFGRGQEKQVEIIPQPIEPDDTGRARAQAVDILPMLEAEAKEKERERKTTFQKIEKSNMEVAHSSQQAAAILNTNRQYVSDVKRIAEEAPFL